MTQQDTSRAEHYQRVRQAFNELNLESQARFLLEATATTIAHGIDVVAQTIAEEMEETFQEREEPTEDSGKEGEEQPKNEGGDQ